MIQGSPDWHDFRRTRIGASEAPIIMGISPWKTPYKLWQEKIGLIEPDKMNSAMQRGVDLEPIAREKFIEMTGIKVFPAVIEHPEHKWMSASLDGHNLKGDVVEIKCAGRKDHEIALDGKVPEKYFPQLQHQMAVSGADKIYYFSFDGENGVIIVVPRDDSYIKNMIEKEKEFYRCMIELESPPLTDKDYVEKTDHIWEVLSWEYQDTKARRIVLEEREERIKEQLVQLCNNQPSVGAGIRLQKILKKGTVEYKKIPELKGVDLEKYRRDPTEYWKISDC